MTSNRNELSAALLRKLENDGHDFDQTTVLLIDAMVRHLRRLADPDQRTAATDQLVSVFRLAMRVPAPWPTPGREAVAAVLTEAQGQGEGFAAGYCRVTKQPFTIAFNAKSEPVRFSVGRPRTEAEQAEAERQATRAVFQRTGLRKVETDEPIH